MKLANRLLCGVVALLVAFGARAAEEPAPVNGHKEIIDAIPANLLPETTDKWTPEHAAKVNEWVQTNYAKRSARVTVVFFHWKEPGRRINGGSGMSRGDYRFGLHTVVTFAASKEKEVPITPGRQNRVTVEGPATYKFALITTLAGEKPRSGNLTITLDEPKIVK